MRRAVHEIVDTTIDAFVNEDLSLAAKVEPLEQVIDELDVEIEDPPYRKAHGGRVHH